MKKLYKYFGILTLFFGLMFIFQRQPTKRSRSEAVDDDEDVEAASGFDSSLEAEIKSQLVQPSTLDYNFSAPLNEVTLQNKHLRDVDVMLGKRTGGFFVEYVANDGEWLSSSALFEAERGWSGLLVEPSRDLFAQLVAKRRRAFAINACLSKRRGAKENRIYHKGPGYARFLDNAEAPLGSPGSSMTAFSVTCYPLEALLHSLGNPTVDLLVLDADGTEAAVMGAVDWTRIDVKLVMVSSFWVRRKTLETRVRWIMGNNGYSFLQELDNKLVFIKDYP